MSADAGSDADTPHADTPPRYTPSPSPTKRSCSSYRGASSLPSSYPSSLPSSLYSSVRGDNGRSSTDSAVIPRREAAGDACHTPGSDGSASRTSARDGSGSGSGSAARHQGTRKSAGAHVIAIGSRDDALPGDGRGRGVARRSGRAHKSPPSAELNRKPARRSASQGAPGGGAGGRGQDSKCSRRKMRMSASVLGIGTGAEGCETTGLSLSLCLSVSLPPSPPPPAPPRPPSLSLARSLLCSLRFPSAFQISFPKQDLRLMSVSLRLTSAAPSLYNTLVRCRPCIPCLVCCPGANHDYALHTSPAPPALTTCSCAGEAERAFFHHFRIQRRERKRAAAQQQPGGLQEASKHQGGRGRGGRKAPLFSCSSSSLASTPGVLHPLSFGVYACAL